jgi:membrane protease YdiL (CAAX protease family)
MTESLDGTGIVVIAALSAIAEELVFRGLLMPWLGLIPQALLFGIVHAQLSGPSRWVWVAWASVVGLALGAIFALSGSLLGAMVAHGLINAINLAYLKSHDTTPPRNSLGGLLSDRKSPAVPEPPALRGKLGLMSQRYAGKIAAGRRA